ncbi:hypothetical protein L6270_04260 [Candidatus Parcubacteria bacterium]|nr:hypothetical protein [Patescibacteria group bacterium]MBU4309175.1 hypothetical protein [Patescibacteria group bacterium]MBU4432698.1 hypothetical protein [Patescibacteria group bacterium]MBU4577536.1 hypothetical protein [Patescibacteria group bacterium]MCG2697223.1 hypothetical protein [Candidatus Parcubacteria bacterium]
MDKYHHELHIAKHLHLSSFLHNKYNNLVIADTLRLIALSMVSLFVPIFLYKNLGLTIHEIAFFELFLFIGAIFCHYFVLTNISRWGIKRSLIISYFLNVVFYLILGASVVLMADLGKILFLFILALIDIMASSFYWTAHHVYFLKATKAENGGEKLGLLMGVPTLASIVSPLLGATVITVFGFYGSFLVSALFVFAASMVLLTAENIVIDISLNFEKIFDFGKMRKNIIFIIQGMGHVATGFLWPILLFFLSVKLISIGFLYLVSNSAYALVSYLGGKRIDKNGSNGVGKLGAVGHGVSLVFRAFSTTIFAITTFQTMGGVFGGLLHVALDGSFYKQAHDDMANNIMNREMYMHIGRILGVLIFISFLSIIALVQAAVVTLIITGVLTFVLVLIFEKKYSIFD